MYIVAICVYVFSTYICIIDLQYRAVGGTTVGVKTKVMQRNRNTHVVRL